MGIPSKSTSGRRRFTLIDGMILIAASAVAVALVKTFVNDRRYNIYEMAAITTQIVSTPTILILQLRGPRPSIRRLLRQPGFVVGVAGTAILALGLFAIVIIGVVRLASRATRVPVPLGFRPQNPPWYINPLYYFGGYVAPAMIAAGVVLALSGRRRPARGWLDLLGRAIGVAWILFFLHNARTNLLRFLD